MRYCHVAKNKLGLLCLSALILCIACMKSSDHDGPMPQPTKEAPVGFEFDTAKRITVVRDAGPKNADSESKKSDRPAISAEQIKELKRSLPAIEDSRIVEPLEPTPHSRLARMTLCMDLTVAKTTGALLKGFKRKMWTDVTVSTPSNDDNYRSFSANSKRFRLNGTTTQGEFENCKKSLKQSRVSLSFRERQPSSKLGPKTEKAILKKLSEPGTIPHKKMQISRPPAKKDAPKTELK